MQSFRYGAVHGDPSKAQLVLGFTMGTENHRSGAPGTWRPGRSNFEIARRLTAPGILELPKILEKALAVAYVQTVESDTCLAVKSGPLWVVEKNRQPGKRLSVPEVVIQGGTLAKESLHIDTVMLASVPIMATRVDRDVRQWGLNTVTIPGMDKDFSWGDLEVVPMKNGEYYNAHPWTANRSVYRTYDLLARVRDNVQLYFESKSPNRNEFGSLVREVSFSTDASSVASSDGAAA